MTYQKSGHKVHATELITSTHNLILYRVRTSYANYIKFGTYVWEICPKSNFVKNSGKIDENNFSCSENISDSHKKRKVAFHQSSQKF